jgi:DNA-directed RNA polymerase subunit delta
MKRIIKDYKNITPELLHILNEKYPEGIDEDDLISFTNHLGEIVKAVEIRYEDDIYLIKVSRQLTAKMDEAMDDEEEEEGDDVAIETEFGEDEAAVEDTDVDDDVDVDVDVDDADDDDDFDDADDEDEEDADDEL